MGTTILTPKVWRITLVALGLLLVAGCAIAVAVLDIPLPFKVGSSHVEQPTAPTASSTSTSGTVELVPGSTDTLVVPETVRKALGIGPPALAKPPSKDLQMVMPGSTALDPTRVMRVRTRFNAEIAELGPARDANGELPHPSDPRRRELRSGDMVRQGDVLAVVWSIDVGGKKSDLVDALVQLRLDEKRLEARKELWKNGNLPEDTLNQTRRDVITDRNNVDRAERILRTWNVPEKEIQVAREEAEQVSLREGVRDKEKERLWAKSEILAPRSGTIVERNVGVGEYVADNTINLFMIADVGHMQVIANPPEDLLPTLLKLPPDRLRWKIQTVGATTAEGPIDEIGYLLDPNQHTAVVKGYIENPEVPAVAGSAPGQTRPPQRLLRAGQFVTATVNLPTPPNVVEVPLTALVDDGKLSFIFVQPDPSKPECTLRRVVVTHRFEKTAFVKSKLTPEEKELSPEEIKKGLPAPEPLEVGTPYLTTGALELRAALDDRLQNARAER
jgi:cobalt-zinc-cadmium efflux system membrane fusion protein